MSLQMIEMLYRIILSCCCDDFDDDRRPFVPRPNNSYLRSTVREPVIYGGAPLIPLPTTYGSADRQSHRSPQPNMSANSTRSRPPAEKSDDSISIGPSSSVKSSKLPFTVPPIIQQAEGARKDLAIPEKRVGSSRPASILAIDNKTDDRQSLHSPQPISNQTTSRTGNRPLSVDNSISIGPSSSFVKSTKLPFTVPSIIHAEGARKDLAIPEKRVGSGASLSRPASIVAIDNKTDDRQSHHSPQPIFNQTTARTGNRPLSVDNSISIDPSSSGKSRSSDASACHLPSPSLPFSVPSLIRHQSASEEAKGARKDVWVPVKREGLEAASSVDTDSCAVAGGKKGRTILVYKIPEHLKEQLEKDVVPGILRVPLCPSNYGDFFACLLHAEDFYLEKWSKYLLKDVTLKLCNQDDLLWRNNRTTQSFEKKRDYVSFDIDTIPEKRPYLLSRDFVFLQPTGISKNGKIFQGSLVRVIRSKTIFAEFSADFYSQHKPKNTYDVSFSFNRVCLKRAHHAVANALGPVLFDFLFPVGTHTVNQTLPATTYFTGTSLDRTQMLAVHKILMLKHPTPFLIQGPLTTHFSNFGEESYSSRPLSKTGHVIVESILKILARNSGSKILICAPTNKTCDILMQRLSDAIPESGMFRANAAFRVRFDVPADILSSSSYDDSKECFTCPPPSTLKGFKVISSTYMSSFRLSNAGIGAGHFTHIFLVDASSVAEPEAVVPLSSLACEKTVVVVSGRKSNRPSYVRSDVARRWGLQISYFERLLQREPYSDGDLSFVCNILEAN